MITITLTVPTDTTSKPNRMTVIHKLLNKAVNEGIISKKHQVSREDETVLDLDTKKTYGLAYEKATYVNKFELVEIDD